MTSRRNGATEQQPLPPRPLRLAAAYAWRLLVVAAAVVAVAYAMSEVRLVVLGALAALVATALLRPPVVWLRQRGWRDGLASLVVLLVALLVLAAILFFLVPRFVDQLDDLGTTLGQAPEEVGDWLVEGPLDLSESQLDEYVERAEDRVRENSDTLLQGAFTGAALLLEVLAGTLLALVLTFFFLKDGDRIWAWLVRLFPARGRGDAQEIGRRSWRTLGAYLRGVTVVAAFDAVFIGLALVVVGVPAALPLAVLTFFGAYVPIAGAVITGLAAVLVALVANGALAAGVIALAVLIVQQVESNLLQPVVVGRAVEIHPVATLLAVTTGALIAGVPGAFVAVPLAAIGARIASYLDEGREAADREDYPGKV